MLMGAPEDFDLPPDAAPLDIIREHKLAPEFSIYNEDEEGKIEDNERKFKRTILKWDGHIYK
jgi:hypothetical protein